MTTIDTLYARIKSANEAYRNGTPVLTDAVYDALEDELRALDPNHPHFQTVGALPLPGGGWPKVKHAIPMGSLNKAQIRADLDSWWPHEPVVVTHKLDGISCFDGATPVHLANGEVLPIQEIVEKGLRPQVLTWNPEEGVTTRQVTNTFDNGDRDNWVRLTLEDGSTIVVTEDHKFYVPGDGWVPARALMGQDLQTSQEWAYCSPDGNPSNVGDAVIHGATWVVGHLSQARTQGNTQEGRNWVRRLHVEQPVVVFACTGCPHTEEVALPTGLERARHLAKLVRKHEAEHGGYRCGSCMRVVAAQSRQRTTSDPTWRATRSAHPSWQSQAEPEVLQDWIERGRQSRKATSASKTPEERRRGVEKQWQSLSPEARAARAAKIGAWSKKNWEEMTPEARAARVRKMVTGLPRSAVSDEFRTAVQQAGLYDGFQSEVVVSGFLVDECNEARKLILEFHGDYYHCNPRKFTDPNWMNPTLKMTAGQKWKYDRRRMACFLNLGFRVLVVWESDWKTNPQQVLAQVRAFLGSTRTPQA